MDQCTITAGKEHFATAAGAWDVAAVWASPTFAPSPRQVAERDWDLGRHVAVEPKRLTWAIIERGVEPRHRGATVACVDRLPGTPLLGFFAAATASMLLWSAAAALALRLI